MTNHDPGQFNPERRLLLALLLSTLVLLATPSILRTFFPGSFPEPPPETIIEEPITAPTTPVEAEPPPPEAVLEGAETTASVTTFQVAGTDARSVWTNQGAIPTSVRLNQYRAADQGELELMPQGLPMELGRPLEIRLEDPLLNGQLSGAVFEVEVADGTILQAPVDFLFRFRRDDLGVVRRVSVSESGLTAMVSTEVTLQGRRIGYDLNLGPGIGDLDTEGGGFFAVTSGDFSIPGIAYFKDEDVERYPVGSVEASEVISGPFKWAAFESQYFAYAVLADGAGFASLDIRPDEWVQPPATEADEEPVRKPLLSSWVRVPVGTSTQFFFGPKDLEILGQIDQTLRGLVDYGFFGILVRPLLFILKWIYGFIGNYGWAIIGLTLLINLALLPLRYKQITSMKKMADIQPQMKAIQERFKKLPRDDPKRQELNQEMMALYQKHGVNPLSGCLPIFVQMPFLFAFYRMLASSIELRGAPFILWVQDLAKPDPYYVTPIAMGVSMGVQQMMTPSTGDPATRKAMMIMPVVFTFLFLQVSSGLALYFLFSNLFGMLFQVVVQKMNPDEGSKPSSKPKKNSRKSKSR